MPTVEVPRPPRAVPRMPGGELAIEPPPEPERPVPPALLARLLPGVMLLGSVGFVALGPRDPSSLLFGGMFALSTVGMLLVGGGGRSAGQRQAVVDEERRDYLRYLATTRRRVRVVVTEQRAALEHVHPDPAAWPTVLAAGRLWERRSSDPDFGLLRTGTGAQRLATALIAPQTGPVDGLEPVTALALRRFLRAHAIVPELPVALSLHGTAAIWLEAAPGAGPEHARALARALVAQYVLWHGPTDALLAVVAPAYLAPEWEWVKWLPHAAHPRLRDAVGPMRMITARADDVRHWWEAELAGRAPGTGAAEPHLLVVVDDAAGPGSWAAVAGTTVLRVGAPPGRRPTPAVVRLLVGPSELSWTDGAGGVGAVGRPDAFPVAEATALARRLARYRPAGAGPLAGPESAAGLPELLGLARGAPGTVTAEAVEALRVDRRRRSAARLCVPVGVDDAGAPVALDLKESAQGGSGPHGLCIGATGSGKSELLRTLVLGLVATHSSDELNLVLVDFKGGATFLGLGSLPHVSAVITNLADELHLVDRMADALEGELTRRQELLRAAGNLTGVAEYAERAAPAGGPAPAAGAAGRRRRVLRAARPASGARRSPRDDRAARPIARDPPAARVAAARRGPAARARFAPLLPDRAAHLLRCRVARCPGGARRPPVAARARLGLPRHGDG